MLDKYCRDKMIHLSFKFLFTKYTTWNLCMLSGNSTVSRMKDLQCPFIIYTGTVALNVHATVPGPASEWDWAAEPDIAAENSFKLSVLLVFKGALWIFLFCWIVRKLGYIHCIINYKALFMSHELHPASSVTSHHPHSPKHTASGLSFSSFIPMRMTLRIS